LFFSDFAAGLPDFASSTAFVASTWSHYKHIKQQGEREREREREREKEKEKERKRRTGSSQSHYLIIIKLCLNERQAYDWMKNKNKLSKKSVQQSKAVHFFTFDFLPPFFDDLALFLLSDLLIAFFSAFGYRFKIVNVTNVN
jgi:hypothetical protein